MVELQDLPCRIVEVDMQDFPSMTIDELDSWETRNKYQIHLQDFQEDKY